MIGDVSTEVDHEAVLEEWIVNVASAYKLAKASRLDALRGDRKVKTLDSRMMHPFSEMLGRAGAMHLLLPELGMLELHPVDVLREAERDARQQFVAEEIRKIGATPLGEELS